MSKTKAWLQAFRLRTLPLALASIMMGGFLAAADYAFRWDIFLLCISTTIFLQVLSNLANDYGDSIHGADSTDRKGPSRTVQAGLISKQEMVSAIIIFSLLALCSGISLLFVSFGLNWSAIIFFFGLGLLSILAALGYTLGRKPYGYIGLGDFSVLIFFGFVGVMGSYYLFTQHITIYQIFPALSCGLLSIGVLNINNIRDIESDKKAGKFSIPVRIGKEKAVIYHWALIISALSSASIYTILQYESAWQLLFLLSIPLFVKNGMAIQQKKAQALDPYLKQMALSTLLFVVLFGLGTWLG